MPPGQAGSAFPLDCMTSIRRLRRCSLPRLDRMHEAISLEIERLGDRINSLEENFERMVQDEATVALSKSHGGYQLELDRVEEQIDSYQRKIENLQEKRETLEEVRQAKHLRDEQVRILGSDFRVTLKDGVIFLLILCVLTLLTVEVYNIGAPGSGAEVKLRLKEGKIDQIEILAGGQEYSQLGVILPSPPGGSQAIATATIKDGVLTGCEIVDPGSGYAGDPVAVLEPSFSRSTLWMFWIADTVCCLFFLLNFFFECRLAKSKRWYWKRNWIDFVTSIPLPPIHLLLVGAGSMHGIHAGRVLRAIRILRAIRALRMFLFIWRGMDHLSSIMDVKLLKRSLLYALIAMFGGALIFMTMERIQDGDGSFPEALWWSFTTLVTGGFADIHDPSTMGGKILTVLLGIGGMVLVGVFTATLTSILVRDDEAWQQDDMEEQFRRLDRLEKSIGRIDQRLDSVIGEKDPPES